LAAFEPFQQAAAAETGILGVASLLLQSLRPLAA
jgi:hypothetical protein